MSAFYETEKVRTLSRTFPSFNQYLWTHMFLARRLHYGRSVGAFRDRRSPFRYDQCLQTTMPGNFPSDFLMSPSQHTFRTSSISPVFVDSHLQPSKGQCFLSWWQFSEVTLRVDCTPFTSNPKLKHRGACTEMLKCRAGLWPNDAC